LGAFAAVARRPIDDALSRKIVRQRPARRIDPCPFALLFLLLRSGDLGLGPFLGPRLLEIGDGEFKLLDELLAALRGLPELLTPGLSEHEFQPLRDIDEGPAKVLPQLGLLIAGVMVAVVLLVVYSIGELNNYRLTPVGS
jgi:hypothetical protein